MTNKTIIKDASSLSSKIQSLFSRNTNKTISRCEIIDTVIDFYPGTNAESVIPSDYCYNIINKGIPFNIHLFESLSKGEYKCLGKNYPYTGDILWKGSKVGEWKDGDCKLWKDPRE